MAASQEGKRRGRPHLVPIPEKADVVLSVLTGQETVPQAAARAGVAVQTVWMWRRKFIEAGKMGLEGEVVRKKPNVGEEDDRLTQLKIALGEIYLELFKLRSQLSATGIEHDGRFWGK
ncbi:helix-turn-helix domain-containing protein [Streptomyces sp. NPDC001401]|uniref:helix-turn-helix domain-containing protein n=1 Tax=Streptomyces sp. NPDC001401 TaxID=3364570 RepID=UPI00368D138B